MLSTERRGPFLHLEHDLSQQRRLIVNRQGGCECGGSCGCGGGAEGVQHFRLNFVARNSRRTTYEGRETLVVPIVLLREAVVNGAFVAAGELVAHGWNGVPVTVGHPKEGGGYVTANEPATLSKWSIGRIFGAHVSDAKLKGEAWLDVKRAEKVAPGLIEALERGDEMDVSTGYFPVEKKSEGVFNGKQYAKTHHNLIPDHLALLPNEEGACSWADGCGVRNNSKGVRMKLTQALNVLCGALGIELKTESVPMKKDELIAKIVANSKMKKDELETMDEKTLAVIANGLNVNADGEDGDKKPDPAKDGDMGDGEKKPAANEKQEKPTVLSAEDQDALAFARGMVANEKTKLVEKIVANTTMKKDDLEKQSLATLQMIAAGIPAPVTNFGGRAAPVSTFKKDEPVASMIPVDVGETIRANRKKEAA